LTICEKTEELLFSLKIFTRDNANINGKKKQKKQKNSNFESVKFPKTEKFLKRFFYAG